MDFFALVSFLALYYLRPQEWFAAFSSLHPIQILSVLAIWAMIKKESYKGLIKTPLDWMMLAYFLWTLIAGFTPRDTLSGIQSVILFYFVGACSLDTIPRLKKFIGWWCCFIFIIAGLAVLSQYGFDPLGGNDIVQGSMKGRLILNISVFDNPNSLAHSIIPAVPFFYYLVFWRRITMKILSLLVLVPLYCIYLTQSKGAFLCGFATLLATLTIGRSKIWQLVIIFLAVGLGYGALYTLPRMNELKSAKGDPAIQGRIAAFTYGLHLMQNNFFGVGLGAFQESFTHSGPVEKIIKVRVIPPRHVPSGSHGAAIELDAQRIRVVNYRHYTKATHSAYNQNGAELGYVGLYLFVGILYCCVRTLLLVKSKNDDEERIRRALFSTVVAYAVSSWMVDFCYRPTFFMFVAATSAFHRFLILKQEEEPQAQHLQPVAQRFPWLKPIALPGMALSGAAATGAEVAAAMAPGIALASTAAVPIPNPAWSGQPLGWEKPKATIEERIRQKFTWTRLNIWDFLIIWGLTYAAILYWKHLIVTM